MADRPKRAVRRLAVLVIVAGLLSYLATSRIKAEWTGEIRADGIGSQVSITPSAIEVELAWWRPPWKIIVSPFGKRPDQWSIGNTFLGFLAGYRELYLGGRVVDIRQIVLAIPWWFIVAILAAPKLSRWQTRWIARRQKKIVERGLCTHCGYDLRASPDRCPECGKAKATMN